MMNMLNMMKKMSTERKYEYSSKKEVIMTMVRKLNMHKNENNKDDKRK